MGKELEGIVERLTPKGFVCAGQWVGYSKFYKGTRFTDEHIGCSVKLVVHEYQDRLYADQVTALGDKNPNVTPSAPPKSEARNSGGNFRRLSPEEFDLKKLEGPRIARSVGLQWATTYGVARDLSEREILSVASIFGHFVFTGDEPEAAISPESGSAKSQASEIPATEPSQASEETLGTDQASDASRWKGKDTKVKVNELFRVAKAAGLIKVPDPADVEALWTKWGEGINTILGQTVQSPYHLTPEQYAQVEASVRELLKVAKAA